VERIFTINFIDLFSMRAKYLGRRDTTSGFTDVDTAVARA